MAPMSSKERNTPRRIFLFIAANLLLALVITLLIDWDGISNVKNFAITWTWTLAICVTQWLGHRYLFGLLDRRWSWQDQAVKRALIGVLVIVLYSVLAYYVVRLIMYALVYGEIPGDHFRWALQSSYIPIGISFIITIIFLASGFLQNWKASLVENERIRTEMLMYKYEALQNQINPHFLFNSFNVLSDLVYEDQAKAVNFIRQLSQLFRYVLDNRDKELVSLSEELDFLDSYTYLLKTRFEDKLELRVELEAQPGEMLVPMTLQLLVENCVKHNEISSSQMLRIHLTKLEGRLRVENNLQPRQPSAIARQTGLSNLCQQYSFFTEEELRIIETDHLFAVEVPILKLEKP
jgi:two-component system LytT family sensor kinase